MGVIEVYRQREEALAIIKSWRMSAVRDHNMYLISEYYNVERVFHQLVSDRDMKKKYLIDAKEFLTTKKPDGWKTVLGSLKALEEL